MIRTLDHLAKPCPPEKAVLLSESQITQNAFQKETLEKVTLYRDDLANTAETCAAKRGASPIKEKPIQGEEILIEDYPFHWNGMAWHYQSPGLQIKVDRITDKEDLSLLLKTLRPIEEKILSKGIGKKPIQIEIGCPQWTEEKVTAAASLQEENLLWFPQTKDSPGRLLASALHEATSESPEPVSLQGIFLHEIAHLMEPNFQSELLGLQPDFWESQSQAKAFFEAISPHYLPAQLEKAGQIYQKIKTLEENGVQEAKYHGILRPIAEIKDEIRQTLTQEILAETIRSLFLDPIMGNPVPTFQKPPWPALERLTSRLQEETQRTHQKGAFFAKPKTPTIFPLEIP